MGVGPGLGEMMSRFMVLMPFAVRAVIIFVPIAPLPPVIIASSVLGSSFGLGEVCLGRYRSENRASVRPISTVPKRMDILAAGA